MTLYSYKGEYPKELPNRIYLSNGRSRTDKSTFTEEELLDAGWVVAPDKPEVLYPNKLEWDTDHWVVRAPNETEIQNRWREVRSIRDKKLTVTDYSIMKAYENGQAVDSVLVAYRQALRDIPQNNTNPFHISWPVFPDE